MNANACPLYTGTIAQGQGWHDTLTYSHPSGKGRCVHCAQPFSLHFNAEATEATCPDCQGTGLICPSPAVEEPCTRCSGRGFLLNEEATEAVAKPVPDAFVSGLNLNTSETRYNHVHVMRRGGDRYLCGRKASPIEFRSKEQATCIRCVAALKKQLKQ